MLSYFHSLYSTLPCLAMLSLPQDTDVFSSGLLFLLASLPTPSTVQSNPWKVGELEDVTPGHRDQQNRKQVLQATNQIYLFHWMTVISDYYNTAAIVFSIVALSIAPLLPLFFKQYFRGLQFLQMSFLFASVMNTAAFSSYLTTAMISFNKNLLVFCTSGDFVCSNGFPLSFAAVLVALLLLIFVFISFRKCCRPVEYEPAFIALKGCIKWFYVPLAYSSTVTLLSLVYSPIDLTTLLPPAVVLGVLTVFPLLQLLVKKCIQKQNDNVWVKWLQCLDYLRLLSTAVLVACYVHYQDINFLYEVMIALIIYPLLHALKADFKYPVMQRIVYVLGEALFLAIYYLFKFKPDYITTYDLDFYGLGGVLVIDILLYFVRTVKLACYGMHEGTNAVNPEMVDNSAAIIEPTPRSPREKKSKYEHDSGEDLQLQNSRDEMDALTRKNNSVNPANPKKRR